MHLVDSVRIFDVGLVSKTKKRTHVPEACQASQARVIETLMDELSGEPTFEHKVWEVSLFSVLTSFCVALHLLSGFARHVSL